MQRKQQQRKNNRAPTWTSTDWKKVACLQRAASQLVSVDLSRSLGVLVHCARPAPVCVLSSSGEPRREMFGSDKQHLPPGNCQSSIRFFCPCRQETPPPPSSSSSRLQPGSISMWSVNKSQRVIRGPQRQPVGLTGIGALSFYQHVGFSGFFFCFSFCQSPLQMSTGHFQGYLSSAFKSNLIFSRIRSHLVAQNDTVPIFFNCNAG